MCFFWWFSFCAHTFFYLLFFALFFFFFLHITLKYNTNLDSLTLYIYIYIYVSSYFFLFVFCFFFFVFYSFLFAMYSAMIVRTVSHRQAFRRVPNSILTCSHFAFINWRHWKMQAPRIAIKISRKVRSVINYWVVT